MAQVLSQKSTNPQMQATGDAQMGTGYVSGSVIFMRFWDNNTRIHIGGGQACVTQSCKVPWNYDMKITTWTLYTIIQWLSMGSKQKTQLGYGRAATVF